MYDGYNDSSDYLAMLTGVLAPQNITSSGNHMLLGFFSDSSVTDAGFHANIHVSNPSNAQLGEEEYCNAGSPCSINEGDCDLDMDCAGGNLRCGENNCPSAMGFSSDTDCCFDYCPQWLDLGSGTLTSPNYPNDYDVNLQCSWLISASGGETVNLHILDFNVSCFHSLLPKMTLCFLIDIYLDAQHFLSLLTINK